MTSNHTRFSHSVNNLRFCSRVSALKQDRSKSLTVTNSNQPRRSAVAKGTRPGEETGGRSINLPPVDVGKNSSSSGSKNCFAVDLLQLANGCGSRNIRPGGARASGVRARGVRGKSAGNSSEGSVGRRSRLPRPSFQASVASAPESCRKQSNATSKHLPRRQSDKIQEYESDFAKSWPLAPHAGGRDSGNLLPLIGGNTRKLSDQCPMRARNAELLGGINKFNQAKAFRMRLNEKRRQSDATKNHVDPNHNDAIPSSRVVMETLTDLKISGQEGLRVTNLSSGKKPREESTDCSSDLTTVTAESTRVHPDDGAEEPDGEESDEREELDRKCIQWLEDVARERIQNPEKVFLPHLLMS